MIQFKSHEVRKEENDYVEVILHLDPGSNFLEEFSKELDEKNDDLEVQKAAQRYVKKNLPNTRFNKIKVMVGGIVVATMLGTALAVPAGNLASAESVAISGGQLSVDTLTVGTFTAVLLNGKTQSTFTNITDFNVSDPTGSGAGWHVTMTATQFTESATGRTLPTGSLTVAAPSVAIAEGATGSDPVGTITAAGGTIDEVTGVKILSATTDGGMGTYTTSFATGALALKLLPKDVKSGTYTSTISVEISTGP